MPQHAVRNLEHSEDLGVIVYNWHGSELHPSFDSELTISVQPLNHINSLIYISPNIPIHWLELKMVESE